MKCHECAEGERGVGGHERGRRGGVEKTHLVEGKKNKKELQMPCVTNNKRITSKLTNKAIANTQTVRICAIVHVSMSPSDEQRTPSTHMRTSGRCFCDDPNKWCQRCNFKLQYRICEISDLHKMQKSEETQTHGALESALFLFVTYGIVDRLQAINHRIS